MKMCVTTFGAQLLNTVIRCYGSSIGLEAIMSGKSHLFGSVVFRLMAWKNVKSMLRSLLDGKSVLDEREYV
jgi:hypothetical protein